MRQIFRYTAALFALVVALAACGSSPYKGLTKAEFLRRSNESCTHPTKDALAVRDLFKVQLLPDRKAKLYLEKILPLFDSEVDRIAKLKPPKADRARVKKILDQARDDAKKFAADLKDDPVAALSPKVHPFQKSSDLATAYGLKICAD
ncbi:MAG TPA: hypothetical protein VL769_00375 [Acidimicrobiia bacterium]|jgi:hypothetical protein|nr:hypothetical protein [Acidimicrobiia bacterium]